MKDAPDTNEKDHNRGKPLITITVNEQPVKMEERIVTGGEIKQSAIAQGVQILPTFVLIEELPNGKNKTIGDNDEVKIRPHSRFNAIAPDDNS